MSGWRHRVCCGMIAAALLTSGCGEAPSGESAQGTKTAGEVLGGTISDAMIPLEQLESQSPLAPRQAPAPGTIDAEQPEVTQAEGVEGVAPSEGVAPGEGPAAAPAPAQPA